MALLPTSCAGRAESPGLPGGGSRQTWATALRAPTLRGADRRSSSRLPRSGLPASQASRTAGRAGSQRRRPTARCASSTFLRWRRCPESKPPTALKRSRRSCSPSRRAWRSQASPSTGRRSGRAATKQRPVTRAPPLMRASSLRTFPAASDVGAWACPLRASAPRRSPTAWSSHTGPFSRCGRPPPPPPLPPP